MDKENIKLEEAFQDLEEIIKKLENKDISLEDSFKLYKEGMETLKICNEKIDKVEKKVLIIREDGETDEF